VLDKINASLIPLLFKPFVKFDIAYSPPPLGDICVLSACTIIESLVGISTIHVAKTETTLDEVVEKLSSLDKSLPSILENASRVSELIENIGKRITILEASNTLDNQNLRIGKLEESMKTLSLIFSSLKFKKEKVLCWKRAKIYVCSQGFCA
jgi:hypothetical protein